MTSISPQSEIADLPTIDAIGHQPSAPAAAEVVSGPNGADTITGTDGPDTITDFEGANLIGGGNGADSINGYGTVSGGAGDDYLRGGLGPFSGEAGNDTISIFNGGVGSISGGDGNDLIISVLTEAVDLDGGAGFDTAVIYYEGGPLTPTLVGGTRISNVERLVVYVTRDLDASAFNVGVEAINGIEIGFRLGFESAGDNRIRGSAFADTLSGGGGADTISGGAGDDRLDGGDQGWGSYTLPYFTTGPQTVTLPQVYDLADYSAAPTGVTVDLTLKTAQDTGWGRDILKGFEGVIGSAFNDVLIGAVGDLKVAGSFDGDTDGTGLGARLDGAAGQDLLIGSLAGDTLSGGSGDDTLQGGAGNDLLNGGPGVDVMTGGAGADTFQFKLDDVGPDRITDFNAGGAADFLQLLDRLSTPIPGNGGLLAWNQLSGQLVWDADGDAGAGAPVVVALLQGSGGALTQANLAPGFQPAFLRTIATDGTISNVVADYGAQQLVGGPSADRLAGSVGRDSISAGGGDDFLDGQAGADTLSGGSGADLFIFATDGSVDRALDFNAAEGDFLALFDAQGRLLDGVGGIVIWNQATGALSWDPDSDPGAGLPIQLGTLEGSTAALLRGNFAAGFAPNGVRTILADGDRQDLVFDRAAQAFDTGLATYTSTGLLRSYAVTFDTGATSLTTNDLANAATWSRVVAERDPTGAVFAYTVIYDDGSRTLWQYDTTNTRPWSRVLEEYDPVGRLSQQSGAYDDGTAFERHIDTYDLQPWAYYYDSYKDGALISHTFYNADGSIFR